MKSVLHLTAVFILSAPTAHAQVSGVYRAEAVEASPELTAAGMVWWNDRLIIADRWQQKFFAFTPPDRFEVFKEGKRPVGLGVDPENRLVFTEKLDKVLCRLARCTADGKEETLLENDGTPKAGPTGLGTPHFMAVHSNGTIYWSGFPDGGTRYLLPEAKTVTVSPTRIVHTYGVGLSPENDWLYVNSKIPNKERRGTWRFPVDEGGNLGEGEFFIPIDRFTTTHLKDLPEARDGSDKLLGWIGRTQGLAVDRHGYIYVGGAESHHSGAAIAAFTPDGKTLAAMIVGVPRNVSGLAFGGKDGNTLYITGAGEYPLHAVTLSLGKPDSQRNEDR